MPLLNLVEQACSVGMLIKVRDKGAECGMVKDMSYMPEDGHLVANRLLWEGWVSIM